MFLISCTIAAFAQMLLKKSAMEEHKNVLSQYLNWKVIIGYGMMFAGMLLGVVGYGHGVEVKSGSMMETLGNVWVVILSWLFFREPITKKKCSAISSSLPGLSFSILRNMRGAYV